MPMNRPFCASFLPIFPSDSSPTYWLRGSFPPLWLFQPGEHLALEPHILKYTFYDQTAPSTAFWRWEQKPICSRTFFLYTSSAAHFADHDLYIGFYLPDRISMLVSYSVTRFPAAANTCATEHPISPAPITATVSILSTLLPRQSG